MGLLVKAIISGVLVAAIAEISRRNSAIASLLAALPIVSLLAILWMYHDTRDVNQIAAFSWGVFWYVLPSLLFFVLLPVLLRQAQLSFYPALLIAAAATIAAFFVIRFVLARFGVQL
jgi:uncharacterized membrane protein (GlpM family)